MVVYNINDPTSIYTSVVKVKVFDLDSKIIIFNIDQCFFLNLGKNPNDDIKKIKLGRKKIYK